MIYIFSATIIYTFFHQKDKLLSEKRNMFLYFILSVVGLSLGVFYMINPYLPSLSSAVGKYMK